jgi:NADH:ubiquinone reductase (H+-translocating)
MTINIPSTQEKRVIIIGGGFAGLELAKRLSNTAYQVVLLDKNNYHQFQPLFYQVATAGLEPSSIAFPLRKLFQDAANVFIRITSVDGINVSTQEVNTPLGSLHYDYLVVAIGADTNFFGNTSIAKNVIPMKSVAEALYLRNTIFQDYEYALTTTDTNERQSYSDIVIVGGGPTGVELAGALAEMKRYILPKDYREMNVREVDIYLVQSGDLLLKGMSEKAGKRAGDFLTEMGVKILYNARVTDYDGEQVTMGDGTTIRSKKVIWAAGIVGNKLNGFPAEAQTFGGRLAVDDYLQVKGCNNVFALGDVAYLEEGIFSKGHPQVAQVAIQQAKTLGKNLLLSLKVNMPPLEKTRWKKFAYRDLGSMATVGRNLAVVDLPKFKFQGFFAWVVWLFVHLFAIVGVKNKLFVFLNWVWNYFTHDQSLRLIIKPRIRS